MICCPICGHEGLTVTNNSYTLDIMNLPKVTAHGVTTHVCDECHEIYIDYPSSTSFREDICESLVATSRSLTSEEMVYLRKFSGLSARVLAGIMGKHPVTVSNWENNKIDIPKGAEMLLRYRIAAELRIPLARVAAGSVTAEVQVFDESLSASMGLTALQTWGELAIEVEVPMVANASPWA